jgi:hypothetical protein
MNLDKLTALAAALPETHRAAAQELITRMGTVIEGIGDEGVSWRPQTARLVQGTSDSSKLPDGAKIGSMLLGEAILPQSTKVIVLRSWDARQYWSPDQTEAKMLCSSPDAQLGYIGKECKQCEHSKFDEEANKIDCNKIKVVMVVAADLSDIFLLNFAKTGYKIGNEWQGLMKKAGVAPYRRIYGIKSSVGKQFKNVAQFDIETYDDDAVRVTPAGILEFVTELFTQVGADRKEMVDNFHKMIFTRKENPALTAASNGGADSEVVLVGTNVNEKTADAVEGEKKTSSLASKYSV